MKKVFNFKLVFNGGYVYTNIISLSLGAKKKKCEDCSSNGCLELFLKVALLNFVLP
jgi:hypothetical protein